MSIGVTATGNLQMDLSEGLEGNKASSGAVHGR